MPIFVKPVEICQIWGGDVLVFMASVNLDQSAGRLYAINSGAGCCLFQKQCFCRRSNAVLREITAAGVNDGESVCRASAVCDFIQPCIVLNGKLRVCCLRCRHCQNAVAVNRCCEYRNFLRGCIHDGAVQFFRAVFRGFNDRKYNASFCLWYGISFQLSTRCLGCFHHLRLGSDLSSNTACGDVQQGILTVELQGKN